MSKDVIARNFNEFVSTVLAKICYPVADEIGAGLRERLSQWRQRNALSLFDKVKQKRAIHSRSGEERAPPRLVHRIVEEATWSDDDHIQDMWAGLLVSSCSEDGQDESNLVFIGILSQLTRLEARILDHACVNCEKEVTDAGLILPAGGGSIMEFADLQRLFGVDDIHRLDRELDHLRALGLLHEGIIPYARVARLVPTPLALQLYVRCQGFVGSPAEYFGVTSGPSPSS